MKSEQELRNSTDWDIVELKLDIDVSRLADWYNTVEEQFSKLKFNLGMLHLIKEKNQLASNIDIISPGVYSYGVSWPVEQSLPIPPRFAAKTELYPEVEFTDFEEQMQVMEIYKFGYFKELLEMLGEDTFSWSRITIHDASASIDKHSDGPNTIRLHIPIITNNNAWFYWGDKQYNLKPGKVYLINTSKTHSTANLGSTTRAHIISHPVNVAWLLEHLS